jgi:hypothetical protein
LFSVTPPKASVSEYCAASEAAGIPPPPYLQLLSVDLLLQQEQHYQAVQLLYSQSGGSTSLAQHLLEKAGKSTDQRQAGAAVGAAGAGVFDAASPGAAMALELALDVMTRQAVPELRPVGLGSTLPPPAAAAAAAAAAGAAGGTQQQQQQGAVVEKVSTAALVRQLLDLGEVLQAARIARTAGGVVGLGISAATFVEVAAARRDLGALAAVYRVMRPHVVDRWPDYEAARAELCGAAAS